jgi:hypothetical protein
MPDMDRILQVERLTQRGKIVRSFESGCATRRATKKEADAAQKPYVRPCYNGKFTP